MATEIQPAVRGTAPKPAPTAAPRRNARWTAFRQLVKTRFTEMWREPEVIFWVFVFPLLLAVGLGVAFRQKPGETSSVAIVAGTQAQRAVELIRSTPAIHADVLPPAQAVDRFRLGKYALVIQPQADGRFEYLYDPARPESVLARAQVDDALQSAAGRKNPLTTSARISSEPGSRYIDFLIPGLIGMNLENTGLWLGFVLVEMRQRKLLKRFVATPMRRGDFLLAVLSSRLLLMLVTVLLLLGFGVLFFHMRVIGSWAAILLIGIIGSLSAGALGLLASCRAQKIETASGIINLVMLPMWVFSGVFFSYERFPAMIQPAIKALPLTALNDAFRSVVLEGAPLRAQGMRLLVLAIWGGVSFVLAAKWFRWT